MPKNNEVSRNTIPEPPPRPDPTLSHGRGGDLSNLRRKITSVLILSIRHSCYFSLHHFPSPVLWLQTLSPTPSPVTWGSGRIESNAYLARLDGKQVPICD